VLQEFAELTAKLVEDIEASKLILERSNNEIGMLCESMRSLEVRLSGIVQQLGIARIASVDKEFAAGSEATEVDLADLQQASAAPSANVVESVDQDSQGTAHLPLSQSPHDQSNDVHHRRVSPAIAPVFPLHGVAAQNESLTPPPESAKPSQGGAISQRHGSALTLPLVVGGVAASALLGVGLIVVGSNLFRQPEPGTPAKSVSLPQKPLPASNGASSPPGPVAAVSKPAPPAQDTLKIDCPDVCWVEVNRVVDGNTIYANMLKGSVEFPIGKGLKVSSGRSDILKLTINDGAPFVLNAREMISSRLITSPS
jgi:hypothetical protein